MRHMREHMTYEKHMTLQTESCFFWTLNNRWDITQVKKAVPWLVPWISLSWAIYDAVFSFLFASDDHQVVQHKRILRAWNLSLFQLKWKGSYKAVCVSMSVWHPKPFTAPTPPFPHLGTTNILHALKKNKDKNPESWKFNLTNAASTNGRERLGLRWSCRCLAG